MTGGRQKRIERVSLVGAVAHVAFDHDAVPGRSRNERRIALDDGLAMAEDVVSPARADVQQQAALVVGQGAQRLEGRSSGHHDMYTSPFTNVWQAMR